MLRGWIWTFDKPACYFSSLKADEEEIKMIGDEIKNRLFEIAEAIEKLQLIDGWFLEHNDQGEIEFWTEKVDN